MRKRYPLFAFPLLKSIRLLILLSSILIFNAFQAFGQNSPSIYSQSYDRYYNSTLNYVAKISNDEAASIGFSLSFNAASWEDFSLQKDKAIWFDLRDGKDKRTYQAFFRICTSGENDCAIHTIYGRKKYHIYWNGSTEKWDLMESQANSQWSSTSTQSSQTKPLSVNTAKMCNFGYGSLKGNTLEIIPNSRNSELEQMVDVILDQWGISNRSFEIAAANVDNAAAVIKDGKRYILYNTDFMRNFDGIAAEEYWWKVGILAHEIGHHVQGHTLTEVGSRPLTEKEADHWSGFALSGLGATIEQAQIAVQKEAPTYETPTHPSREERTEAIREGFRTGKSKLINPNANKEVDIPQPEEIYYYESEIMQDGKRWTTENINIEVVGSWCYENDEANCEEYGRLYTWEAARKICDKLGKDWYLPTIGDWQELLGNYGGFRKWYYKSPEKRKREDLHEFAQPWVSNQELLIGGSSGFNALLGGSASNVGQSFRNRGQVGNYWSSSHFTDTNGRDWPAKVDFSAGRRGQSNIFETGASKTLGFSCRCVRDY